MVPTHPRHTDKEIDDMIHNIGVAARVALGGAAARRGAICATSVPVDAQKFDIAGRDGAA